MQQLDFHKERSIPTGDAHVTVSPYDLLALVRGLDEVCFSLLMLIMMHMRLHDREQN